MGFISHHHKLAVLLRECANNVERDEFHPDMYQAVELLHTYARQHSSGEEPQVTLSPKTKLMDRTHVMNSLGKQKGLKKGLGLEHHSQARINPDAAHTMSHKNAERAKADLGDLAPKAERGHRSTENDWCDEHFCLGSACKEHRNTTTLQTENTITPSTPEQSVHGHSPVRDTLPVKVTAATTTARLIKPTLQGPVDPDSILIAKGWVELQCPSGKRGRVWKNVLASLVEGRKPGEDTTLWIQRETTNAYTGEPELEILHQIPMKWLMDVEYLTYSTWDHRFALKLNNVKNWVLFKCAVKESAQYWVSTLRRVRETSMKDQKVNKVTNNEVEERGEMAVPPAEQIEAPKHDPSPEPSSHRMTFSDMHSTAHDVCYDTAEIEQQVTGAVVSTIAGSMQSNTTSEKLRHQEELGRELEMDTEMKKREAVAEEEIPSKVAEQRRRMAEEIEQRRKAAEEEERKRQLGEEQRRRQLAKEKKRRRKLAEEDLVSPGNHSVEEKLKEGVRKLQFFLHHHPDKLPRELTDELHFRNQILWDITSDAWDEFEKPNYELYVI